MVVKLSDNRKRAADEQAEGRLQGGDAVAAVQRVDERGALMRAAAAPAAVRLVLGRHHLRVLWPHH